MGKAYTVSHGALPVLKLLTSEMPSAARVPSAWSCQIYTKTRTVHRLMYTRGIGRFLGAVEYIETTDALHHTQYY